MVAHSTYWRKPNLTIAILGGTGDQGPGLALRLALAGEDVIIGSRSKEKAEKVAVELNAELGGARIKGEENAQAAAAAEIVMMTVPYSAHISTLESVKRSEERRVGKECRSRWSP